jgi:hypothetical protein
MATSMYESWLIPLMETKATSQTFDWSYHVKEQRRLHPVAWELLRPSEVAVVEAQVRTSGYFDDFEVARALFKAYQEECLPMLDNPSDPRPSVSFWVQRLQASVVRALRDEANSVFYQTAVWANARQGPVREGPLLHPQDPREGRQGPARVIPMPTGAPQRSNLPSVARRLALRDPLSRV